MTTLNHKTQPSATKQKAVWASLSKLSIYVSGFGVFVTIPYLIAAIWPIARILIGFRQPVGTVEHDLHVWAIVAGFGLTLALGGLALGAIGRAEYRRIEAEDPSTKRRMPNKP